MSSTAYEAGLLPDLLPIYYKKVFPYESYYRWMNYGGVPKTYFTHREFSFTLKDDVYIRYLSFTDQKEFERELQKKCPHKIDIGAVFTHRPKDHKTVKATAFQAVEKELVFDIDMTDYDDVRRCCSGADICSRCWPLMIIAVKVIDRALRDDFGFDHILWVYSGRRGIHCWVCDPLARSLSQNARSAIADYLTVIKGGENQQKRVNLSSGHLHPSLRRALNIIDDCFEKYAIEQQDFMGTDEQFKQVLALVPDENIRSDVMEFLSRHDSDKLNSGNRWATIRKLVEKKLEVLGFFYEKKTGDLKETRKLVHILDEIKLQFCYPRLDVNVSKGINHLLKSPFCIHPKTGRVCVPMDPNCIDSFDPFSVPTINQLCEGVDEKITDDDGLKKRTTESKHGSLKGSLEVFEEFLEKLELTWKEKRLAEDM